jgi:hypothetical protein
MKTFERVCKKTITFYDEKNNHKQVLEKGKTYLTSDIENNKVCVFTTFWFWCDVSLFKKNAKIFTDDKNIF